MFLLLLNVNLFMLACNSDISGVCINEFCYFKDKVSIYENVLSESCI